MEPSLAVVHLVRAANGWEPFNRFMASYEAHPPGVEHRLVVAYKGFPDGGLPDEYRARLAQHGATTLALPDTGYDIGSYWAAARLLREESLCFLNSFSMVLDDGWLGKLVAHIEQGVGLIGASGSWQSHNTLSRRWFQHGAQLLARRPSPGLAQAPTSLLNRSRRSIIATRLVSIVRYAPFPNPHIRTNAFLLRRDLMLSLRIPDIASKDDALRFESGRAGLTRQVQRRGLAILVVGRDGVAYPPDRWPESHTYRSGDQTNLLVSDNRTEEWADFSPERKEASIIVTWGRRYALGSQQAS